MNPFLATVRKAGNFAAVVFFFVLVFGSPVLAAPAEGSFRNTYDVIMIWVNFLILVVLLYKFGKKPITEFIMGSRDDIAREIKQLENQSAEIKTKTEETLKNIEDSKAHFQEVSERIVEAGEKARASIIEDAKNQSRLMLEDSKKKLQFLILTAEKQIRSELIDEAMDLAEKRIPEYVTAKDNERFLEQYFSTVSSK